MDTIDGLDRKAQSRDHTSGRDRPNGESPARSREGALDEAARALSAGQIGAADYRAVAALETYMASLRAGRPRSPSEFLAEQADISPDLSGCFTALEFIEAAAAELSGSSEDATSAPPEPVLLPESRLGDYHIVREIGRGGMGVVYEANQISLGRLVALKVLPFAAATDPKQRQRFHIEAQAAAQLHHPHIVPVFGVGCDAGIHYYAMQFVDGDSLSSIIRDLRSGDGDPHQWAEPPAPAVSVPINDESTSPAGPVDQDLEWDLQPPTGTPHPSPSVIGKVRGDRVFCRKVARLGAEAALALEHAHSLGCSTVISSPLPRRRRAILSSRNRVEARPGPGPRYRARTQLPASDRRSRRARRPVAPGEHSPGRGVDDGTGRSGGGHGVFSPPTGRRFPCGRQPIFRTRVP
jgi:hypothetical protein